MVDARIERACGAERSGNGPAPAVAVSLSAHARHELKTTFATWVMAVVAGTVGCDDAQPKVTTTAPVASGVSLTGATSAAPPVGDSCAIDVPPAAVASARRLKQRERGDRLVIDSEGDWAADCLIHRACKVAPEALEPCPPEDDAEAWGASLASKAEHFTDPRVRIKGRLAMSDGAFSTAVGCTKGTCCNRLRAKMVLAGPPYDLELVGLGCAGDESRLCCPFSARNEEVIARGSLTYQTGRLLLDSPRLCRTKTN